MSRSQAGNVRIILIGILIILVALVGASAWFGYKTFKPSSPQPAAPSVAVRSKIPAPPAPMKVPQPQKIEAPEPEPPPSAPVAIADPPDQPAVAGGSPATADPETMPASGQAAAPKLQAEPSPAATVEPSVVETTKEQARGSNGDPEPAEPGSEQVQDVQARQPVSSQTTAAPVTAEENTDLAPAAESPASPAKAARPVKTAPEKVAAAPAEQENPAAEPAATKPAPSTKSVSATANTEPQRPAPFTIQVGAYLTKAYAEEKQTDLKQRGYAPFIYRTVDKQQRTWHMVRVGHFEDRQAAEMFLSDFTAKENMPAVIALTKKR